MKLYLLIITSLLILTGCENSSEITKTLYVADSLMSVSPKQAMCTLEYVDIHQIHKIKNKAYYALLYTQAQHKNFIPITSDSLINIALDYYKGNKTNYRLLYTKALMYKGAALTDMGLHSEAMEWYKMAEETADSTEYYTLALINSRIGELYQNTFIDNNEAITRYKKALHYFKLTGYSKNINNNYALIGQQYKNINIDSAYYYIHKAIESSKSCKDTISLFKSYSLLSIIYFSDKNYNQAKELSLYVVNSNKYTNNFFYHCLSRSYANLNKPDSAIYYLNLVTDSTSLRDKANYYITLTNIEKSRNNYNKAYEYSNLVTIITDSILYDSKKTDFVNIEKRYDNSRQIIKQQQLQIQKQVRDYIIIFFILTLIILSIVIYNIISRNKHNNIDNLIMIERLRNEFDQSIGTLTNKLGVESKLNETLDNHIKSMKQLVKLAYKHSEEPTIFMAKFKEYIKINKLSDGVWINLKYTVNEKNYGIIDYLKQKYPKLTNDDLNIISLICCEFSYLEIAVCMGYTNERSACNKRTQISKKLNLNIPIEQYINNQISILSKQRP